MPSNSKPPPADPDNTVPPRSAGTGDLGTQAHSPPLLSGRFMALPTTFGRYRLLSLLGQGGMGAVYRAHDTQLDRVVALKVPSFSSSESPQVRERFLREARAAATLHHANLCPVFDAGEIDGILFLTMAFIEGKTLASLLASLRKPLTERQAAALLRKLALALAEAHRKQIIHRDLKPANVMLTARGEPVIMDFGLASSGKQEEAGQPRLTQIGMILGTPAYMAPEQAEGAHDVVGPASDVYSLGVIFYELLTGKLPFTGDLITLLSQVLMEEPTPPSRHRPGLDPRLEAICLKAMAKKPAQRFASMADLAATLTDYLRTSTAQEAVDLPITEAAIEITTPPLPRKPRRRVPMWVAMFGVMVAATAAVVAIRHLPRPPKEEPLTPPVVSAPPAVKPPLSGDLVWQSQEDLAKGRIAAPDLSRAVLWFSDDFHSEGSGFFKGKAKYYADNHYYIRPKARTKLASVVPLARATPPNPTGSFVVELIGRVIGEGRWGVALGDADSPQAATVTLSNKGVVWVRVEKPTENNKRVEPEPGKHPAVKKGDKAFNRLLLVVAIPYLEIYVNGAAVCNPFRLERLRLVPKISLYCATTGEEGPVTAEFESIKVWSAASLPSLEKRGAVHGSK